MFAYKEKRKVIIKISDNGWGIPKEKHERIFESGYRGNSVPGGSGIGLHYTQMWRKPIAERSGLKALKVRVLFL